MTTCKVLVRLVLVFGIILLIYCFADLTSYASLITTKYSWSSGWTTCTFYTVGDKTYGLFLKESNGKVHIHEMNEKTGTLGNKLHEHSWSKGWRIAESYEVNGYPYVLFMKETTLSSGAKETEIHIHKVKSDGNIPEDYYEHHWRAGWKLGCSYEVNGNPYVLFMKETTLSSGAKETEVHIHKVDSDHGNIGDALYKRRWNNLWTTVKIYTVGNKDYLFLLDESSGMVHIRLAAPIALIIVDQDAGFWCWLAGTNNIARNLAEEAASDFRSLGYEPIITIAPRSADAVSKILETPEPTALVIIAHGDGSHFLLEGGTKSVHYNSVSGKAWDYVILHACESDNTYSQAAFSRAGRFEAWQGKQLLHIMQLWQWYNFPSGGPHDGQYELIDIEEMRNLSAEEAAAIPYAGDYDIPDSAEGVAKEAFILLARAQNSLIQRDDESARSLVDGAAEGLYDAYDQGWHDAKNMADMLEAIVGGDPPIYGNIMAFPTQESHIGQDLNADGDTNDTVLRYKNLETGEISNTGLIVSGAHHDVDLCDGVIAFVGEGSRICYYNTCTGIANETGLTGSFVSIHEKRITFTSKGEICYFDLNSQKTRKTGVPGLRPVVFGDLIAFSSGAPSTIKTYDIQTGELADTGVIGTAPDLFERVLVLQTAEFLVGMDLNGDGDTTDWVIRVYDLDSGEVSNTYAVGMWPALHGTRIAFQTAERELGQDLNKDGRIMGNVIRHFDLRTKEVFNTRRLGNEPSIYQDLISFYTFESWEATDLNHDGDHADAIVLTYRIPEETLALRRYVGAPCPVPCTEQRD